MDSRIERLERELHLKQLQINSLLNITQAINSNVKAEGLFKMYQSFLSWEMSIQQMSLFFQENGQWTCVTSLGVDENLLDSGKTLHNTMLNYTSMSRVEASAHPFLRQFELVIPVLHKKSPIAYTFIGGIDVEWCYRAWAKGWACAVADDITMEHRWGEDDRGDKVGSQFLRQSPDRLYYYLRNAADGLRLSHMPVRWKRRHIRKAMNGATARNAAHTDASPPPIV